MSTENNDLGRVADGDQALVNEAAAHLHPSGFDPSRDEISALTERLRKRADDERQYATSSAIVSGLLQPQLDAFNRRDGSHSTYAVRLMLDHRNSAKKDAQFADDLEAAIAIITAKGALA